MNIPVNDYRTKYWDLAPSPNLVNPSNNRNLTEKKKENRTCQVIKRTLSAGSRKLIGNESIEDGVDEHWGQSPKKI